MINEEAKSSIKFCKLPSGYLTEKGELLTDVRIREMTGVEEDLISSDDVPAAAVMDALLSNCIVDFQGISNQEKIREMVLDLTVSDRALLVTTLRRATVGDIYRFPVTCPSCKAKQHKQVDLTTLETVAPKDPKKRTYEVKTPRGHLVELKVMTGRDEQRRDAARKDMANQMATLALWLRVVSIDGKPATVEALRALSSLDRSHLRNAFEKAEAGTDTSVDTTCSKCKAEFKVELDVTERSFFFPSET